MSQSWQQTKALSALQKASESVKRKQKVVFVFAAAASSGAARYVMAPGNKLHDSSSQRRTRIITFNKELYVCLRVFMGFPGVLPRHSRWDHQSETICRVHQRSQRTTLVPDQDDVVPTAFAWYTDMQCPLDQEAKFSYTAKWSSGDTDMQSSLDQEAKSSKTAKWSSGTL